MFQYFSTILYVHFRNSREGKSTSGVRNPCVLPTLYRLHQYYLLLQAKLYGDVIQY